MCFIFCRIYVDKLIYNWSQQMGNHCLGRQRSITILLWDVTGARSGLPYLDEQQQNGQQMWQVTAKSEYVHFGFLLTAASTVSKNSKGDEPFLVHTNRWVRVFTSPRRWWDRAGWCRAPSTNNRLFFRKRREFRMRENGRLRKGV